MMRGSIACHPAECGIEVIRGLVEALPIKEDPCSTVLLVTVICFLDNPVAALYEINRILFRRGFLIVAFIECGKRYT
jgi:ubiquinone/menaquinone biosynthesis C-methylase UbiE